MDVSVIIPTYNRSEILRKAVDRLEKALLGIDGEIVIVDDGSDKENKKILKDIEKRNRNVRCFKNADKGPASARNLAVKESRGKILLFVNDDTMVEDDFVRKHLEFHRNHKAISNAVFGRLTEPSWILQSPAMKWLVNNSGMHFKYLKNSGSSKRAPWYYFWTCNVSVKADFVKSNNLYFDNSFPTAAWEDIEYGYRLKMAGLKLYFDGSITAFHDHAFEFDDVMARFYSHGRGLYYLKGKIPEKIMPPLSKKAYRKVFKSVSFLLGGQAICEILKRSLKNKSRLPNILMQYLIINEKIRGYEYEEKR